MPKNDKEFLVVERPFLGKDINHIPSLTPPHGAVQTVVKKTKPPVKVRGKK